MLNLLKKNITFNLGALLIPFIFTNFIFAIDKLTIMIQGYVHFLLLQNTKKYGQKVMTEPLYRF